MSSTFYPEIDAKPTHHIHSEDEPLPGPKGGLATADYSADTLDPIADPSEQSDTTRHDALRPATRSPELPQGEAETDNKPTPNKLPDPRGGTYPAELRQDAKPFEGEPAPTTGGDTSEDVPVQVNTDNNSQGGTRFFEGEPASTTSDDAPGDVSVAVNADNKPSPNELPGTYPAETLQGGGHFKDEPAPTTSDDAPEDVSVAVNKPSPNELPGAYPAEIHQGVGRFEGEPAPATSSGISEDVPAPVTDTVNKPLPKQLPSSQSGTYPETPQSEGRFEGEPVPTTTSELPDSAKKVSLSDKVIGKAEKVSLFSLLCRSPVSNLSSACRKNYTRL